MTVSVAVEPWATVRGEIAPLWVRHHAEIARDGDKVPLAPDWAKYDAQAAAGKLHVVVARVDGALAGYVFAIVDTHLHYATTLCGFVDIYWLAPEHRLTGEEDSLETLASVGAELFVEMEDSLRRRGVRKLFGGTKLWRDNTRLFEALGWVETERLFTRWIGD